MKQAAALLVAIAALMGSSDAFAPVASTTTAPTTSSSALSMGLFDFMQPPKKKENLASNGMDNNVFGGRGKRITIREDEDAAMWVEDPKDKKKKKGGK